MKLLPLSQDKITLFTIKIKSFQTTGWNMCSNHELKTGPVIVTVSSPAIINVWKYGRCRNTELYFLKEFVSKELQQVYMYKVKRPMILHSPHIAPVVKFVMLIYKKGSCFCRLKPRFWSITVFMLVKTSHTKDWTKTPSTVTIYYLNPHSI